MFQRITTISQFVVLESVRSRFFLLILFAVFASFIIGIFAQSVSVTEGDLTLTSLVAALLRFVTILSLSLLIVTTISREFQSQSFDIVLASDMTRTEFYLGKLLGFSINAFFIIIVFSLCLLFIAAPSQVLIWSTSLFLEALIIIAFALFCSVSIEQQPISIFVILAFYLLARSISALKLIAETPILRDESLFLSVMPQVIGFISMLLPDLSRFTQTNWLVYETGMVNDISGLFLQTVVYVSLLVFAGLIDFYRKNY